MPLPLPKLDSRTWVELTTEGRALIPRAAPAWTDHNVHDPGVTLMELYAWLAEMLLYRLDRVSPAVMRAFLRLVGVEPMPAGVAETVLALRLDPAAAVPASLPSGLQVEDPATGVVFEAAQPLVASRAWIDLQPPPDGPRCLVQGEAAGATLDHTAANASPGQGYWALGPTPRPGDSLRLGFDRLPAAPGVPVNLQVWTMTWETDADLRRRIAQEWEAAQRACPPQQPEPGGAPGWWRHHWAETRWEYLSAGGMWLPLEAADPTRGLTLSGLVMLTGHDGPASAAWQPSGGRWWLRSRLVSGGYECPPRLAAIAINALPVRHAASRTSVETLGWSQGQADQSYRLAAAPVVAGSTRLRLTVGQEADTGWREVLEWGTTGPGDRDYRLRPDESSIAFGDGRRGLVPPAGALIEAAAYRVGGGSAGNLPAGRLVELLLPGSERAGIAVAQPFAATGGEPAESLDHAHGRALQSLAEATRGVTSADLEALALETPGVPVARAKALPGFHPGYPCFTAAGVVGLVVVPSCGSPPVPSPAFLGAVQAYLERRRPLTTELHVVGPGYVPVTVTATLHADPGAPAASLRQRAQEALDAFFDPLKGGPQAQGWPFGRAVLAADVLAVLGGLAQVRYVDGLGLSSTAGQGLCVNLPLCPTELVDSRPHLITVVEA